MKIAAVNKHKDFWREKGISDECARLMPEIDRLRKIVKVQNRRYRAESSRAKQSLVEGRLGVYSRALPIVELGDLLGRTHLPSAQQKSTNAVKHAVRVLISEAAVL
jgi:hypothetical protein